MSHFLLYHAIAVEAGENPWPPEASITNKEFLMFLTTCCVLGVAAAIAATLATRRKRQSAFAAPDVRPGTLEQKRRSTPKLLDRTPLRGLRGAKVLCIADDDNLRISAKECGAELRYDWLLQRIARESRGVEAWAVTTVGASDARRVLSLKSAGWKVHAMQRHVVQTVSGPTLKANADHEMCCLAGLRLAAEPYDAVVIGTGDGDLALAVANAARMAQPHCRIYTLAVIGCCSHRLLARNNPEIAANIFLGKDVTNLAETYQAAAEGVQRGPRVA
ncbi:MAG: NYN domain-containing protein [Bryobacterales bacterium]|nr:NYN domain-containing protein [Bryobacterales bacterium]